jgi:hypothetical protein
MCETAGDPGEQLRVLASFFTPLPSGEYEEQLRVLREAGTAGPDAIMKFASPRLSGDP